MKAMTVLGVVSAVFLAFLGIMLAVDKARDNQPKTRVFTNINEARNFSRDCWNDGRTLKIRVERDEENTMLMYVTCSRDRKVTK